MRTVNTKPARTNGLSFAPGVLSGIGSFLCGFLLTRHFVSFGSLPNMGAEVKPLKVVVWYFYNAHFIGIDQVASGGGNSVTIDNSVDLIALSAPEYEFLRVLPPAALILGGVLLAARRKHYSAGSSMMQGAQVAFGYLPSAVVAAYLASKTSAGFGITARIGPSYVDTLILGGLLYPLVFGAVGGLLIYIAQNN